MVERRKFHQQKSSACVIQKHYRAYQLCQRERVQFLKLRKSALLIQVRHFQILTVLQMKQLCICVTKNVYVDHRHNSVPTYQEKVTCRDELH